MTELFTSAKTHESGIGRTILGGVGYVYYGQHKLKFLGIASNYFCLSFSIFRVAFIRGFPLQTSHFFIAFFNLYFLIETYTYYEILHITSVYFTYFSDVY